VAKANSGGKGSSVADDKRPDVAAPLGTHVVEVSVIIVCLDVVSVGGIGAPRTSVPRQLDGRCLIPWRPVGQVTAAASYSYYVTSCDEHKASPTDPWSLRVDNSAE
jgi:hypothetical protein